MIRALTILAWGALAGGLLYRLYPLALGMPALAEAFLTEDGYLMLTVARNMGTGLGMSVSAGTIPTNGVQPLIAFVFAIPYWLFEGDKVASLYVVHLIHLAIAIGAALSLRTFAARVLDWRSPEAVWPLAATALWFVGPLLLYHSMNGLETGLVTLVVLVTLLAFGRVLALGPAASLGARLGLGALCGLAFLARNDAAFLVIAIFAIWWITEVARSPRDWLRQSLGLIPPGLACLALAAPWMINNALGFGSIVPISGTAQSVAAAWGGNLDILPVKLFEHVFPMLPVPGRLEAALPVRVLCGVAVVAVLGWFFWRILRHAPPPVRAMVLAYAGYGLALAAYYGTAFGAPHFLSRYLAPLAPLFILALILCLLDLARAMARPGLPALAMTASLVICAGLLTLRLMPGGYSQGHEQVRAWVTDNVAPDTWVGAVQTGTLGYWHDRTMNLDGKVNPEALAARRAEGHVLTYVVESEIDYIIDWYEVGRWIERTDTPFPDTFERIVFDPEANLSVQRRRGAGS